MRKSEFIFNNLQMKVLLVFACIVACAIALPAPESESSLNPVDVVLNSNEQQSEIVRQPRQFGNREVIDIEIDGKCQKYCTLLLDRLKLFYYQ